MKAVSMLLLSLSLVSVVSACGGGNGGGNGNDASGNNNATNTTAPANAAADNNANAPADNGSGNAAANKAEDEAPPADLGGRTITIAQWWDAAPKGDTPNSKLLVDKQKEIEQKYNVKISYVNVPFDQYQQKFTTTVLAGKPFADIIRLQYDWALTASVKGQLQKLNDFISISDAKAIEKAYPLKGEDYGFGTKGGTNDGGVYYNRDLVKKLGLTDPQDLVAQNKWNWDEFEKLAKDATQDTNNDGKPDTWGWSGWDAEAAQFFVASNGGMFSDDTNGKEMISDPRTIEAVDFENKLYNVDHVVKVKKGDVDLWEERMTFTDNDVLMTYGWAWECGDFQKANINYGYVPFPIGPKAQDYINPVTGGGNAYFIAKGVDKADEVARIYDELNNIESTEDYPGQEWLEQNFKTQNDIDLVKGMAGKIIFMNYTAYPDFPVNTFISDVIKNKVPAATAAEKVKQQAQASIDKILKTS